MTPSAPASRGAPASSAAAPPARPSFAHLPTLGFDALPYVALDGTPWPLAHAQLTRTARAHGLPAPLRVAYVELNPRGGRGTLVFVHGLGSYLKFWRHQLDAFAAQGYRVLAVDLPGFGKSDKPDGFPYTAEAQADALHELLVQRRTRRPVLVGHSLGGQVALAYALRHPGAVGALALTAPAGFEAFSAKEQQLLSSVTPEAIARADEAAVWRNVADANFRRWRPELEWLVEERVRLTRAPGFDAYARAQVRSIQGLAANEGVRTRLAAVRAPAAILYGEKDALIPNPYLHPGPTRGVMEAGHRQLGGSQLVELAGCGHAVQLDCPEEYNAALARFLAETQRRRTAPARAPAGTEARRP